MKTMKKPVSRLASNSILRSFQISEKKHLIITGSKGIGKSTLANELMASLSLTKVPSLISKAVIRQSVLLSENIHNKEGIIGLFHGTSTDTLTGNQMSTVEEGFLSVGIPFIEETVCSDSQWIFLDELGYLESNCIEFQNAVLDAFDKKQVLAVIRKQNLPFLNSLLTRSDAFIYDMDEPVIPVGCVIMASGMGKRFGSNKLMADVNGKPMISNILDITGNSLFVKRIVVTRHTDVKDYCREREIPVILHDFPERNITVRLGLSALMESASRLYGCLFAVSDQPFLTRESLETMVLTFSQKEKEQLLLDSQKATPNTTLYRLGFGEITGNPVLFSSLYFNELLTLPNGKGGNIILKEYPERILTVSADSEKELCDIDTVEDLNELNSSSV